VPEKLPREIYYYKDYYLKFFNTLTPDVQKKINWTIELLMQLDRIPEKYFKHITGSDDLYEIRIEYTSRHYRILCFFDDGNLIILVNSFLKQTTKIPKRELKLAGNLKKQYFDEKRK